MIKIILSLDACSFIYTLIFAVVFFSKKRIQSYETQFFSFAIIATILGIVVETAMLSLASINYSKYFNIVTFLSFLYVVHYYIMYFYLTIYVYLKSYAKKHTDSKDISNMFKKLLIIFSILLLVCIICSIILKGEAKFDGDSFYGTGGSVVLIIVVSILYIVSCIVSLIKNKKIFTRKEKTFYYICIALLCSGGTIRYLSPALMINNIINTIIIVTMFFTIENPDIKLINDLKNANAAKDNFLSSMSHEMKTPLNAILGLSSLDELTSEDIKDINIEANVLLDIVNNVIDLNAFDSEKIKNYKHEFNILDMLFSVINEVKRSLEGKQITFNYNVPDIIINANSEAIIGIIDRILSNSVKYTNEGFINLYIRISDNILNINLKDSGIGMDEETLKNIYNKFERDKRNKDGVIPGLGLGLALVRDTVDALGGTILITSKLNEGTNVDINISLREN